MENIKFEHSDNTDRIVENYLSRAITNYGLLQLNGETPVKLYCGCKSEDGSFIGAVMGCKTLNMFFVSHLYVEEDYRNRGIGSQLLSRIESLAKGAGCNLIRLNTLNIQSQNFYATNGYNETTRINDYMNGFDLVYYDKSIS
jgi:GNAT superfamily N-acetyltransferase